MTLERNTLANTHEAIQTTIHLVENNGPNAWAQGTMSPDQESWTQYMDGNISTASMGSDGGRIEEPGMW